MAFEYAVALTGGIATGKSTLSALMKLYGFRVIDADSIAKQMLDNYKDEAIKAFGEDILDSDGSINRAKLGKLIFFDKEAKAKLESILHPPIRKEIERQSAIQDSFKKPYLVDIPLFFETKAYPIDKVIVVYAPKEIQLKRLIKRDNLSEDEALKRIESQMDIEQKRALATWVIDNSGSLATLSKNCEILKDDILKEFKSRS